MKEEIVTKKSYPAIGPYSQAVKFGNLIFVSGQIGIDPKTNKLVDGVESQTKQIFQNIKYILEEAGADFKTVLKIHMYLRDMNDYKAVNEIYASYFTKPYPARATIEAARLPAGALVEMDCIAYTKENECCGGGCGCC